MYDWQEIIDEQAPEPVAVTRDRLRWLLVAFGLALFAILARAAQLEISDGANFRRLAARPIEREVTLAARRGRILARDGSVLAQDRQATGLAMHFRYLQDPPDASWLRRRARARLTAAERRDSRLAALVESQVRGELAELHARLARLSDVPLAEWKARAKRIDRRVTVLAELVNQRRTDRYRQQAAVDAPEDDAPLIGIMAGLFAPPEPLPPPPVIVVEQTAYHRLVDDVPAAVVAEIQNHPKNYPGVQIVKHTRRDYPAGTLAAHLLGHVGRRPDVASASPSSFDTAYGDSGEETESVVGLMGSELLFESQLGGKPGAAVQSIDRRGRVLDKSVTREPVAGHDLVLSVDPRLQRSAEAWLDEHTRRVRRQADGLTGAAHGGAIVVLDVRSGELLVAAAAPRFDPNLFSSGDPRVDAVLADPARPLFERVAKMALPPGSVFKSLTALALVSEQAIDPQAAFNCQGYLDDPERLRCQLFREQGIGHGDTTLALALAQSCNVYFFHHVRAIGGVRLIDWATRFGFGQPTGVDMADEVGGALPALEQLRRQSQTQMLAVGQAALTATPLQIARLYAAIANGGYLITPRITREAPAATRDAQEQVARPSESLRIRGLSDKALAVVREGLRRTIDDPGGTARAIQLPGVEIAGKTGSAETGAGRADHSWFAGYAPAEDPRYAFVVVLEHAGRGSETAAPIARKLVEQLRERGYLGESKTADKSIPPGKG